MKQILLAAFFLFFSSILLMNCSSKENKSDKNKSQSDDGWEVIFNGQDLSGWEIVGSDEAKFYVENGIIVGETQRRVPNSFLATKKNYEDFILEIEFKVDPMLNSGVQIQSGIYDKDTTFSYVSGDLSVSPRTFRKGVVHGYQIEIDPSDRAWSGGFYEEGGRGWLQPLNEPSNEEARMAYKKDDWNEFKIIANDNHFESWINGVKATDYYDSQVRSGFISLQLHSIGRDTTKTGKHVMFKNIRIKELP